MKLNKVECKQLVKLRESYLESNSPVTSKTMTPEKETNAVNAFKKYSDFLLSLGKKYGFNVADIDTIYDDGEIVFKNKLQEAIVEAVKPGTKMSLPGSKFFVLTGVRIIKYYRDETQDFQCPNCDKIYKTPEEFESHIRSSELKENDIGNYVLKTRLESMTS